MRMLVMLTSLILLLPAVVAAQEEAAPKATIFGGYSYLRNSGNSSFNGWEGQGTFNFTGCFSHRQSERVQLSVRPNRHDELRSDFRICSCFVRPGSFESRWGNQPSHHRRNIQRRDQRDRVRHGLRRGRRYRPESPLRDSCRPGRLPAHQLQFGGCVVHRALRQHQRTPEQLPLLGGYRFSILIVLGTLDSWHEREKGTKLH